MSSDIFPDLHHKMSKKIAQLTKVIYHLNTRNDNHNYELKSYNDIYENEIDDILKDACKKLSDFKNKFDTKNNESTLQLEELKKQLIDERTSNLEKQNNLQKQLTDQQETISKTCHIKIESMNKELEASKSQFSERIATMAKLAKSLELKNESMVSEYKMAHQTEVADLVRSTNKKYSDMLTERMNKEDELIANLNKQRSEFEAFKEKYKNLESTNDGLRVNLTQATKKTSELEQTLAMREGDLSKQLLRMQGDLAEMITSTNLKDDLILEQKVSLREKEDLINELKKQIASLNLNHKDKVDVYEKKIETANTNIQSLNSTLTTTKTQLADLSSKHSLLESDLQAKNNKLSSLQQELAKSLESWKSNNSQLQEKLDVKSKELHDIQKTHAGVTLELSTSLKEIDRVRTLLDKSPTVAVVEALQAEISDKVRRLEESDHKRKELLENIKSLNEQLSFLKKEKDQLESHLNTLQDKYNKLERESNDKENLQLSNAQTSKKLHESTIEKLKGTHDNEISNLRSLMEAEIKRRDNQITDANSKLNSTTSNSQQLLQKGEEERAKLEKAIAEKNSSIESLKEELRIVIEKFEMEKKKGADSALQEVKNLNHAIKTLEDKLTESANQLQKELLKQKEIIEDYSGQIHSLKSASGTLHHDYDIACKTRDDYKSQLDDVEIKLHSEIDKCKKLIAEHYIAQLTFAEQLEKLKHEHNKHIETLKLQHINEIKELEKKSREEKEKLKIELENKTLFRLEELVNAHKDEISKLLITHSQKLMELEKKLNDEFGEKINEYNRAADRHKSSLLNGHETSFNNMKNQLESENNSLQLKISKLKESVIEKDEKNEQLSKKLSELTTQIAVVKEEFVKLQKNLIDSKAESTILMQKKENELKRNFNAEIDNLNIMNAKELSALRKESHQAQSNLQEKISTLEQALEAAQVRFNNRESRPEDLNLISELKGLIISQQQMIAKLNEDIKFFKLELLNREENFNKKFGGPDVAIGVMKVAKPKNNLQRVSSNNNSSSNILSMSQIVNAAQNGISPASLQHTMAGGASSSVSAPPKAVVPNLDLTNRRKTTELPKLASVLDGTNIGAGVRGLMELRESREFNDSDTSGLTNRNLETMRDSGDENISVVNRTSNRR